MPEVLAADEVRLHDIERHARAAIEALFAEIEPRQSRYAYVWGMRSLTTFRYDHVAFDSRGIKPQGEPSASEMGPPLEAVNGLVDAVREWLATQPTPTDRRRLVWRIHPEICERKRGRYVRYAAYCRLTLALTGDVLTFPEDEENAERPAAH